MHFIIPMLAVIPPLYSVNTNKILQWKMEPEIGLWVRVIVLGQITNICYFGFILVCLLVFLLLVTVQTFYGEPQLTQEVFARIF